MTETKKKVPSLRFPEFSGEWEEKRLENLFLTFKSGNGITSNNIKEDGEYPVYGGNGLRGYTNVFTHDGFYILIGRQGALCGNINRTHGKAYISEHAIACQANETSNTEFLAQRLDYYNLNKLSESSAQPGLSVEKLLRVKLIIPELSEQKKIADFLSTIDERIQLLKEKKKTLGTYKKGVMQQIFSQQLRFKDENGKDYPNWEKRRFDEVYSFRPTNSYSRDYLNYEKGDVKNIHYGDIHVKYKSLFDISKEDVPYLNPDINIDKIPIDNYCKEGDLVIADASEDYSAIGKAIEIIKLDNEKVVAGLHTILARPDLMSLATGFGGYTMQGNNVKLQIKKQAQGIKVLGLSAKRLAEIILFLPSLSEQQKIADFLSSIDDKISLCDGQIKQAKQYKKGLLQQMFVDNI